MNTVKARKVVTKIQEIAYHRNGICGAPFHAIRFVGKVDGYDEPETANFLATLFDEPGHCAVICLDRLPEHGVAFGPNSWRGDCFEPELREAVKEHNLEQFGHE